jgi:hypothetical protein
MPEWYEEAKEQMKGTPMGVPTGATMRPVELDRLTDLPHLFVEYGVKESDVLIHLFPRAGVEDQWSDGHYINRCHNCKSEVSVPGKPCPRCGNLGLMYIPGRVEEKSPVAFPKNMLDLIKECVDRVWIGEVAAEEVPELGAYVIQIQRGMSTAVAAGLETIVRRICTPLDKLVAPKN